ncbi:hypothetical protein [Labilibacter marinus]|uniref:hypothetical protein n=1 Tax=Labilibacter marinus TaxID=1477105 RepID=UPI000833DD51|nr:hypothetical protein [Labilibacter marinus]
MRKLIVAFVLVIAPFVVKAQTDVYTETSWEMIFSFADVEMNVGNEDIKVNSPMRFTAWYHAAQYVNFDFTNNIGLYTGLALRNVGFITNDSEYNLEKHVHRSYNLGLPLAVKLGAFDKGAYIYGGAEYELLFHYKEKFWQDGQKYKTSQWFSDRTKRFIPSVFVGVQLPHRANIQFKYYLDDFLNHDYKRGVVDQSNYKKTQVFYVSVSYRFRSRDFKKVFEGEGYEFHAKR